MTKQSRITQIINDLSKNEQSDKYDICTYDSPKTNRRNSPPDAKNVFRPRTSSVSSIANQSKNLFNLKIPDSNI